jgi:hypothetical protein
MNYQEYERKQARIDGYVMLGCVVVIALSLIRIAWALS